VSFNLARSYGTITYEGQGGGRFRFLVRVTEVDKFPMEFLLRPFFDLEKMREILKAFFKYEVWHAVEDEHWILHSQLTIALPKMARPLVKCLKGFAKRQFEQLDLIRLVRDAFHALGGDMKADAEADELFVCPNSVGASDV